jgi:hypothetical protein
MGPAMISFGVLGSALAYLHRYIALRQMTYQGAVIFAAGVLTGIATYLLNMAKGHPGIDGTCGVIMGISLYSAVMGPFLFLPSAWLMRIKTQRFGRT